MLPKCFSGFRLQILEVQMSWPIWQRQDCYKTVLVKEITLARATLDWRLSEFKEELIAHIFHDSFHDFCDSCVSFLHILYSHVFHNVLSLVPPEFCPLALLITVVPPASLQASQAQFEAPKGRLSTDSCPNLKLRSHKNHTNRRIQRCGKMCKEMQASLHLWTNHLQKELVETQKPSTPAAETSFSRRAKLEWRQTNCSHSMSQETESTRLSRKIIGARMYRGTVCQITNDGALVLSKIKMQFDFQTCHCSSISMLLLPLTATIGSAKMSQPRAATCWEVWWASCSLQWPWRVLLKCWIWPSWDFPAHRTILEAAVRTIWHQTSDLAVTIRNSLLKWMRKEGQTPKLVLMLGVQNILSSWSFAMKPSLLFLQVLYRCVYSAWISKRCSSKQQTELGPKWPWLKNLGSYILLITKYIQMCFVFVDCFVIFWAIPM